MDNEDLENELLLDDVPETSEESEKDEQVEADASEVSEVVYDDTQEVDDNHEDIEKQIEERANKIAEEKIEARLIRDRVKRERETDARFAKYQELENILKVGLGTKDLDETISRTSEFYKGQGVNIPVQNESVSLNERDAIILAKADAQDIIRCGEKEMEYEANRIASIPRENRSVRENVMFNELCKELTSRKNIEELKNKGYDVKVLDNEDFKEFSSHIVNKSIAEVYDMYTSIHKVNKKQPKSPGSAKTTLANNDVKEFYTPDEARKFTEEDLIKNPKLEEAIERSMLKW